MLVRAVVSWVLLGAGGALVRAQTAADVYGDVTILSTSIPSACTVVCTPFHTDLANCLAFSVDTALTCVCTAAFLADFQACVACAASMQVTPDMATTFTGYGTTVNAVCQQQVPSPLIPVPSVVATTDPPASPTDVPSSSVVSDSSTDTPSSSSTQSDTPAVPYVTPSFSLTYTPFPIQTKAPSVFASAASTRTTVHVPYALTGVGLMTFFV